MRELLTRGLGVPLAIAIGSLGLAACSSRGQATDAPDDETTSTIAMQHGNPKDDVCHLKYIGFTVEADAGQPPPAQVIEAHRWARGPETFNQVRYYRGTWDKKPGTWYALMTDHPVRVKGGVFSRTMFILPPPEQGNTPVLATEGPPDC